MPEQAAEPAYEPRDTLHLWLLTDPAQPVLVGTLQHVRSLRGVSLRYAPGWLARGFALSEDLPLVDEEFLPPVHDSAAGAVDDARPDRWGERVIRALDRPARLSLMEFLYFAGNDRFGALGVSTSAERYVPRRVGPLPRLPDTRAVHRLVRRVLGGEPIAPGERRLVSPGVSMGGARPKALIEIDGAEWVLKFSEGEPIDVPLVEHATMTLAAAAGIAAAPTRALRVDDGHAVAVQRFDRIGTRRVHALSAGTALRAAGERPGYPELAQLLRRRGVTEGDLARRQMHELFRRMVFNILMDNTDDHEKNHVVLVDDTQAYRLSPAFDVVPSGQALGYQQMRVGEHELDATLDNAMSMARLFALSRDAAAEQVRHVCRAVDGWQAHFRRCGVTARDIASLAEQIDRPFLRGQREGALRG